MSILLAFAVVSLSELPPESGVVSLPSPASVPVTMARIEKLVAERGLIVFAKVDHAAEAKKVGMTLRPTQLLIFGNPKGGTPLMQAAPTLALDLPVKILVWEDDQGKTFVTYNAPAYLAKRHQLDETKAKPLAAVEALASAAVAK